MEDRLVQLENMRREIVIGLQAHLLASEKAKMKLVIGGQHFEYHQGVIDAWSMIEKILEGKTNFYEFVKDVRRQIQTNSAGSEMEVG